MVSLLNFFFTVWAKFYDLSPFAFFCGRYVSIFAVRTNLNSFVFLHSSVWKVHGFFSP
jgi:hypothetical protein